MIFCIIYVPDIVIFKLNFVYRRISFVIIENFLPVISAIYCSINCSNIQCIVDPLITRCPAGIVINKCNRFKSYMRVINRGIIPRKKDLSFPGFSTVCSSMYCPVCRIKNITSSNYPSRIIIIKNKSRIAL
jgi:hypothetical protein